jgi:diguanylate cyclase (GGDEF)-like protein
MTDRSARPLDDDNPDGCEANEATVFAIDAVSGFAHRSGGLAFTSRLVAQTEAHNEPLTAVWLDMDRFRQVNDSFGHAAGDQLISGIAARIRALAPQRSECIRMGSDEFVILIPGLNRDAAEYLARRLLSDIEQPMAIGDIQVRPSVSIGIALRGMDDTLATLLERADHAMIDAKRQGGNRFVISGDEDLPGRLSMELARRELAIENALHQALEAGQMALHYQPIVLPDGRLEAVEALMRCMTPGVQISPQDFIPVAETTGLIVRLGEWSLLEGILCAAKLRDQGTPTKVAINVSRAQLMSLGFLSALHGALLCANVAPELIELELTESLFMDHSPVVQTHLQSIRQAGVGLAIDDFGTGYSCLSSLKDLPATKLKFDRAFICVLPGDRRALAIVKSMTQLARELGITVVAEGVETTEQLVACEVAGVHATQGYFHARPMPERSLLNWIKDRA